MSRLTFSELEITSQRFYFILLLLGGVLLVAAYAVAYMGSQGHVVTGMTNQIVWGLPHVVAILLIISAAGTVNIASLGSVFNKLDYQPYGRISLVLAMSLLFGGLLVILLDLGRADRLIIALTHFNFDSVFAWNILRYLGFFVIMGLFLWSMMDRTPMAKRLNKPLAHLAFIWPLIMMVGAGAIFGELVARHYYTIFTMAQLFIVMSYLVGTACFSLVLLLLHRLEEHQLSEEVQRRLANNLVIFIVITVVVEVTRHLLNYYVMGNTAAELFLLRDAGVVTAMFWLGQCLIGWLLPLFLLCWSRHQKNRLMLASLFIVLGGLFQLYVIIIGGQLQPLTLFPNAVVETSGNMAIQYSVSLPEIALSLGGPAITLFIFVIVAKVLRITPASSS